MILHNTFLNSRKRSAEEMQRVTRKKKKNAKKINWK